MQTFGAMEAAMRQSGLAWEVRNYPADRPRAAVVNLGCGLDQTGRSRDNGQCRIHAGILHFTILFYACFPLTEEQPML